MQPSLTQDPMDAAIRRLVEQFEPIQIILFGSRARGTARPDRDWDLLVTLALRGSRGAKQVAMRVALHDLQIPIDVIVASPEQVNQERQVVGTLIRSALAVCRRGISTRVPTDKTEQIDFNNLRV